MTLALHYALRSDVGLLREGNEDSAYAGPNLLAIADGMGGHAAGEVASAVAISALAPLDLQNLHESREMLRALADAVASANSTLHEMSLADPSTEGMGTTLTALLWSGAQVALCHIGDSRGLHAARRRLLPDHQGSHPGAVAGRRGAADPGGGGHPPAAVAGRAGPAIQHGRRAGPADARGHAGRPVPAVLGRAVRRGHRADAAQDADQLPRPGAGRRAAHRPGAAQRRPGQHHLHRRRRGGHRDRPGGAQRRRGAGRRGRRRRRTARGR